MFSHQLSDISKRLALSTLLSFVSFSSFAQGATPSAIPESEITSLREELITGARGATAVEVRRACKSVIRKAEDIAESSPDAANRWELLSVVFDARKKLLSLEFTDANRQAIFAIARNLIEAPDRYSELRLESDMLLMEKELAEQEATTDERIEALKVMLAKYRGTAAEWRSLVMGSMIATKLLDFDYEKTIADTMLERFAGDHKVIQFRRKKKNGGQIDAIFSGTFKTASGSSLTFPYDLMGQQYAVYFWSQEMQDLDNHLGAVKEIQDQHPGRFRVFSFNLDELPDAGEKILRKMKLDWTALHLPGGRGSPVYRAYAERDPNARFINGQGHVLLVSPPTHMGITAVKGVHQGVLGGWNLPGLAQSLDRERYLAQLRYLFIGDYLLDGEIDVDAALKGDFAAVQACFTPPPLRYRLTQAESLAGYRKAEKLSESAIKKHANSKDVWVFRNSRIIALLGMRTLEVAAGHIEEALKESNAVLSMDLPSHANIVPRFCLAKNALRDGQDPETVTSKYVDSLGGEDASPTALTAGAILALEGNARTVHDAYRDQLLAVEQLPEALWAVRAALRDLHHRYRNFWASPGGFGFGRPQKYELRNTISGLGDPVERGRLDFSLRNLRGETFDVPKVAEGKMLGVLFAEPASDAAGESNLVSRVNEWGGRFRERGVDVVIAFLSGDTNLVTGLASKLKPGLRVGLLDKGVEDPIVRKLGILSADRVPNPLLYRPDGTAAWHVSGLTYRAFGGDYRFFYGIGLAIDSNTMKVRSDEGFLLLAKGEYQKSLVSFDAFSVPAGKGYYSRDYWLADRHQGRALALMGLGKFADALDSIDAAIAERKNVFKSGMCKCHGVVEMHLTKAMILDRMDRGREAKLQRAMARKESLPHAKLPPGDARGGVPVGVYYDLLRDIRLAMEKSGEGK